MDTIKDTISKAIYGDSSNKDTDDGDHLGRNREGTTQRSQTGTGFGRDMTSDTGDSAEAKYKPYEPTTSMRHDASDTKFGGREQIGTREETGSGFGKPAPSSDISGIGGRSENVGGTSTKDTYSPDKQSIVHESSSKTELPGLYNPGDDTSSSAQNPFAHKDDHQHSSGLSGLTSGLTSSSDRKHDDTGFSSTQDSGLGSRTHGTDNTGLSGTHSARDTISHHDHSATGAGVAGLGYALGSGKPSSSDHSRTSAFTEDTSSSGIGQHTPTTHDTTTSGLSGIGSGGHGSSLGSTERDSHTRDTTSSSQTHDNKPSTSGLGGILSSGLDSRENKYSSGSLPSSQSDNKPSTLGGILGGGHGTHDDRHSSGLHSSRPDHKPPTSAVGGIIGSGHGTHDRHSSGQTDNSGIGRSQPDAATSHLDSTSTSHTGTSHTGTHSHDHHHGNRDSPTQSLPLDTSAPPGPTNVSKDVKGNPSAAAVSLGEPPEPSVLAGAVHGGPSTTATGATAASTSQAPNIPTLPEQSATHPTETPQSRAVEANRGTGDAYEKSTGLAAEGGDFDASRPGAGREADRLLDEHGVAHGESDKKHGLGLGGHGKGTTSGAHTGTSGTHTGTDADTKASHTGLGQGATGQHTSGPAVRSAHDDPTANTHTHTTASHTGFGQGATGQHTSGPAVRSAHDDPTTGTHSDTTASHTGLGKGAVGGHDTTSHGAHTGTHDDTHTGAHNGEEKVKFTDKIKDKLHLGSKH